jgi:hypothetical protein
VTETQKESFEPVKDEVYQLLLSLFSYESKLNGLRDRIKTAGRRFLLEELVALRLVSNEIILQICKLDQDGTGSLSLHTIKKALFKESRDEKWKRTLSSRLSRFRSDINILKIKHRNAYIAHRTIRECPNLFEIPDLTTIFIPVVTQAVHLLDYMWGCEIAYGFRLGSQEKTIDLRKPLGGNS